MTREIKFRVYNHQDKEMIQVEELGLGKSSWTTIAIGEGKGTHNSFYGKGGNSSLMQYTGLKDKNGKEIYEGDVLQQKHLAVEKLTEKELEQIPVGTVMNIALLYGADEYIQTHIVAIPAIYLLDIDTNKYEVVGNIYENPELLK